MKINGSEKGWLNIDNTLSPPQNLQIQFITEHYITPSLLLCSFYPFQGERMGMEIQFLALIRSWVWSVYSHIGNIAQIVINICKILDGVRCKFSLLICNKREISCAKKTYGRKVTFFVSSTLKIVNTSFYTCSCLSWISVLVFCFYQELYYLCMCYGRYVLITKSRDFLFLCRILQLYSIRWKSTKVLLIVWSS